MSARSPASKAFVASARPFEFGSPLGPVDRYHAVRARSERLAEPLSAEDRLSRSLA